MDTKRVLGLLAISITSFVWGISFLSTKVAVQVIPPMTLGFMRFALASVILFAIKRYTEPESKIDRMDWSTVFWAGFFGIMAYFYFSTNGVKRISASSASIITAMIPVFAMATESLMSQVKMIPRKWASLTLSLSGICLIVQVEQVGFLSSSDGVGYLMMLSSVLAWVVYSLITKKLHAKYSALTIIYYQTVVGTAFFVPFANFNAIVWRQVDHIIITNVILLGVFASALAYLFYVYAMEKIGISTTTLYLNLIPVVTVVTSVLFIGEAVNLNQIIGMVLVISSVLLINYRPMVNDEKLNEKLNEAS